MLAVELNKALCVAAEGNFALNGVTNARVVACDSAQFALQIVRNKGQYVVNKGSVADAEEDQDKSSSDEVPYDFSTVLVDPPRSGLDGRTCSMIAQYEHIMYISCQPDSLLRDLDQVSALIITHFLCTSS